MGHFITSLGVPILKRLPLYVRQRALMNAIWKMDAARVMLWLKASADPLIPSSQQSTLFDINIPLNAALSIARNKAWSKSSLLVLRLLLSGGQQVPVCHPEGTLNSLGKAQITSGVPRWLLLRTNSSNLGATLDHLLSIWAWKPARATALQLCELVNFRLSLGPSPLSYQAVASLLRGYREVASHLASCLHGSPEFIADLVKAGRMDLAPMFINYDVEWSSVQKLLPQNFWKDMAMMSQHHAAARLEANLEKNTLAAQTVGKKPTRL